MNETDSVIVAEQATRLVDTVAHVFHEAIGKAVARIENETVRALERVQLNAALATVRRLATEHATLLQAAQMEPVPAVRFVLQQQLAVVDAQLKAFVGNGEMPTIAATVEPSTLQLPDQKTQRRKRA